MINLHLERLNKIEDDGDAKEVVFFMNERTNCFSASKCSKIRTNCERVFNRNIFAPHHRLRRVRRRPTQNANSFDEFYLQIVEILL